MAGRIFRGVAVAALFAAATLVGGCGGGSGSSSVLLAGTWSGSMSLSYLNGGGPSGSLDLTLDQLDDFVSGVALWQPVGSTQSIAGPIDGQGFTFLLHFLCNENLTTITQSTSFETVTLTGSFDGTTLTITDASGSACTEGGSPNVVSGASGSLTRVTDNAPL